MGLSTRDSRLRQIEGQLQRAGTNTPEGREDLRRMVAVAELAAAACVVHACGRDVAETAAGFTHLHRFPREEWPAMFDEARDGLGRGSSEHDTPPRIQALDALIAAAQRA